MIDVQAQVEADPDQWYDADQEIDERSLPVIQPEPVAEPTPF